jgi:hypothetical protein
MAAASNVSLASEIVEKESSTKHSHERHELR